MSANIWTRIHPDLWTKEFERALLRWAEATYMAAATPKADPAHQLAAGTYCNSVEEHRITAFQAAGYAHDRSFYRMMIDFSEHGDIPAPTLPEGYTFRTMRGTDDAEIRAVYTVIYEAFKDHYGHVDRDLETGLSHWGHFLNNDAHFDPSLVWLVVAPDGELAGVSMNWDRLGADTSLGWIGTLGVRQAHRRKGLASALLLQSFRQLKEHGLPKVGLGVDADSLTGATRVYEGVGMRVVKESYAFEHVLRPGTNIRKK